MPEPLETECPIACPNRKEEGAARNRGKWGAYGFALVLCFLLLAFSFKRSPDGTWEPKEDPPVAVWAILFPAIGLCLGIQIDAEAIGRAIGR